MVHVIVELFIFLLLFDMLYEQTNKAHKCMTRYQRRNKKHNQPKKSKTKTKKKKHLKVFPFVPNVHVKFLSVLYWFLSTIYCTSFFLIYLLFYLSLESNQGRHLMVRCLHYNSFIMANDFMPEIV